MKATTPFTAEHVPNVVFFAVFFDVAHYLECTSAISMVNDNSDDINLIRKDEKERGPVRDLTREMTSSIEEGSSELSSEC